MGFEVIEPPRRNPDWQRDELILALDLYMRHRPRIPGKQHPDVIELSRLLNRLAAFTTPERAEDFRNPNGVYMKLQNLRTLDVSQEGRGLPGRSDRDAEVWTTFASNPDHLRATAEAIRNATILFEDRSDENLDDEDEDEEAEEGKILTRVHRARERKREIIKKLKARAFKKHGHLACEACEFVFARRYGERGSDFIECHHTIPVSELKPGQKTKITDLVLLCANCHRMVHCRRPWLTVEELKRAILPLKP
jgi:5-methylcytosine-specific restriction protein A